MTVKRLAQQFALGILFFVASQQTVSAAYAGSVTFKTMRGIGTPIAMVGFEVQPAGTCSNWGEHMQFDSSTELGKQLFSALLVAHTTKQSFDIWYTVSSAPDTDQFTGCAGATMAVLVNMRLK